MPDGNHLADEIEISIVIDVILHHLLKDHMVTVAILLYGLYFRLILMGNAL